MLVVPDPQAILFDIGMTLVFPAGDVLAAALQGQGIHNVNPSAAEIALARAAEAHHFGAGHESRVESVGRAWSALLGVEASAGLAAWRHAAADESLYSTFDQDSASVLATIRARSIKTAAVSNSTNDLRDELAGLGILQSFDAVVSSADGHREKPHPDTFRAAAAELNVALSESWFVGDGLINDVLGSSLAGVGQQVVVDRYGIYCDLPCPRVGSMKELLSLLDAR